MKAPSISRLTTNRLSVYLRCLTQLEEAGVATVSSREMAERFHLSAAQIRKDLAAFGGFGVRGVGYSVAELKRQLVTILGLHKPYRVLIVGAGNLGMALAGYRGFREGGFRIAGLVDSSARRVRALDGSDPPVHPMRQLGKIVKKNGVDIVVLAVPAEAGQEAFDAVYEAGVRAVLNFVPVRIRAPEDCEVVTVDLRIHLESLAYHLAGPTAAEGKPGRKRSRGLSPARA